MFNEIPELYRNQTADNEEEGWKYTQGDKNAQDDHRNFLPAIMWHVVLFEK